MRICIVHNSYGRPSGEEAAVESMRELLLRRGHEVSILQRSSAEIADMRFGRARAFFSGIHSRQSRRAMRRLLDEKRPDLVHVHNLYPLLSPSVLPECRRANVPIVMTVHNHRLVCPSGLHLSHGEVCERCVGGREYWCVLRNCEGDLFKSAGYALRNAVARMRRLFLDNVTLFVVLAPFQRDRLIASGFPAERIVVVPPTVRSAVIASAARDGASPGRFVLYAGRVSPEKGINTLFGAARLCPDIPFQVAGSCDRMPHLLRRAPANVEFLGHLEPAPLNALYRSSRAIVLPSMCLEVCPAVVAEAMFHGRPVVASRIGGLPSIVEDGVTGLLAEPGNTSDLAAKIRTLWEQPDLCARMGAAARSKARTEYSPDVHYERLMAVYESARSLTSRTRAGRECKRVCRPIET